MSQVSRSTAQEPAGTTSPPTADGRPADGRPADEKSGDGWVFPGGLEGPDLVEP
jgi:hypothetical protein